MADAIHLKLTGINGESTAARHRDEIVVESWHWGVAAASLSPDGGSATVGRPTLTPFTFAHRVDIASPLLWRACAVGSRIAEAVLSIARPLASAGDYLTLRMTNVLVTSVSLADAATDNTPPLETVSLQCASFEYTYRPQLANGSLGPAVTFSMNAGSGQVHP
jgi:type VI secretion system secreted protein Hcp